MQLVEGYAQHAARIDELIAQYSVGWTLDRMPVVDRNILRLGAYELVWVDETPDAVVLDEMVQLAKEFSTDEFALVRQRPPRPVQGAQALAPPRRGRSGTGQPHQPHRPRGTGTDTPEGPQRSCCGPSGVSGAGPGPSRPLACSSARRTNAGRTPAGWPDLCRSGHPWAVRFCSGGGAISPRRARRPRDARPGPVRPS
ncbi:Transcription antitermination protein NusB [Streptomyces hirsutus]